MDNEQINEYKTGQSVIVQLDHFNNGKAFNGLIIMSCNNTYVVLDEHGIEHVCVERELKPQK